MFRAEERTETAARKHKNRTSEKVIVFDCVTAHNSTVLNNELNWRNTYWAKEAKEIKSLLATSKHQNNATKRVVHNYHHPAALKLVETLSTNALKFALKSETFGNTRHLR